jgi:signal transduction histidine kinase
MFAETLQLGRVRGAEKTAEYYSIITRESERLTQLINNVLDFSRIEGGRKRYDLRLEDLGDVVTDTLHAYSYELDKQGFEVEAEVPPVLPQTLMDRNAMSLALLNLLSNAVKYSSSDRRIRVAAGVADGRLTLSVTDHGIGIAEEDRERVFNKFFRAGDEAVTNTRGSGLGLAIVSHSVNAHGGAITVESTKGEGSTFTITLPIRKTLTDGEDSGRRR